MAEDEAHAALDLHAHISHSYYLRGDYHLPFLAELQGRMSGTELARLGSLCFALLKPDTLGAGKLIAACDWLERRGFQILEAIPLWRPRERQFEALYQYNLTLRNEQNQIGSWWLNRRVYTEGPSLSLLLSSRDPLMGPSIFRALAAAKGPSDPFLCRPGQMRYDLGASNLAMNLFHCADDPISTAREYVVFHGIDAFQTILASVTYKPRNKLTAAARQCIHLVEAALPPPVTTDPVIVATTVFARVALVVGHARLATPAIVALAKHETDAPLAERLSTMREAFTRACAGLREPEDSVLARLGCFPHMSENELAELLDRLLAMGVPLSGWEQLTLLTTAHYHSGSH